MSRKKLNQCHKSEGMVQTNKWDELKRKVYARTEKWWMIMRKNEWLRRGRGKHELYEEKQKLGQGVQIHST